MATMLKAVIAASTRATTYVTTMMTSKTTSSAAASSTKRPLICERAGQKAAEARKNVKKWEKVMRLLRQVESSLSPNIVHSTIN